MERCISALGLCCMVFFAWLLSSHRGRFPWRVVGGGLFLQFAFAWLLLKTRTGRRLFDAVGNLFTHVLGFVDEGSEFVFGDGFREHFFAFNVLPTIIFFSSLMSILYYLGIMQWITNQAAWVMQFTLGTSAAESLSTAANIFVGQTEAPLVVRPYIPSMTSSELMAIMIGGFATIAGGVMAAFVGMGIDAGHLATASMISAPAALLIAKVMQPEVDTPKTLGKVAVEIDRVEANLIEAAANGAAEGLRLALNVGAMLIAFVALIAMCNALIGFLGGCLGFTGDDLWTLEKGFGYAFYPFAWLMGIPVEDCFLAGQLLGTKTVVNEFVAYGQLAKVMTADGLLAADQVAQRQLSPRAVMILTYALCGFANISSIGIQLGGIGGMAPDRRTELARLGLRAMMGGALANFMTACVAGILVV